MKVTIIKLLFICSRNKWRSLTAETIFKQITSYQVRSAGTEENARIKITAGLIGWADIVFVMEKKHERRIQQKYREELKSKKIIRLDIEDEYEYMNEELIELLKNRVSEYIEIPD